MARTAFQLCCTVDSRTRLRVRNLAAVEHATLSRMTATLVREGLDARMREMERIRREFELPAPWPQIEAAG